MKRAVKTLLSEIRYCRLVTYVRKILENVPPRQGLLTEINFIHIPRQNYQLSLLGARIDCKNSDSITDNDINNKYM